MPTTPSPTTTHRIVSITGLVLGILLLAFCAWLGVHSWFDTSSSTASLGVLVAVVLAGPVLLGLGLTLAGVRTHRRTGGVEGMPITAIGTSIVVLVAALVALQGLLGS